ncbi:hypothetical protein PIB30_002431 [Stylosanthes scabra]|uniref:FAR1 domain-containing protein n=1 Tax=Stylosanthes scabra TaxID=79078 RepID=A0ABU6W325_9FABA|nr:hypothetical protein [Stylosanthes scabra]
MVTGGDEPATIQYIQRQIGDELSRRRMETKRDDLWFRFQLELPDLVIVRRSFNADDFVFLLVSIICVVFSNFSMEAGSLDPLLEVDSDRSHESENTEQFSCDVDDQYVPKVEMVFGSLEEARDFYRDYAKCVGFAKKIRNTNRSKKSNEILNQLLSCNREGKRRSNEPVSERTKAIYPSNCPARMYVHFLKMIDSWEISKVVLEHSHPCCPIQAEMFPQHRQISMHVCRTIEIND